MTAYTAPSEIVPIFDSRDFLPDTSGGDLTEARANSLYLRKTIADTATVLETFTAGIATNSLNTTSTSSNLVIGSNTNTGTIFINTSATNNTNADPAIAIGTSDVVKTIKIGSASNSIHLASLDIAGNSLNNTANQSGAINIANLQTTGQLNIATAGGRSGNIYIGNDGTGTVQSSNITIGFNTTGAVNIGGPNGTVNINGQATFTEVPHCDVIPTFSEDLTNKLYVDSRIASGGSNFFYFNYSDNSTLGSPIKKLGNSVVISALQTVTTTQLGTNLIATFISDPGVPNITLIPSGIWELNQWGNSVGTPVGTLFYYFVLKTYRTSTAAYTTRGTSGYSQVVNLTTPSLYFASLSLGSFAVDLEDRIVIEVYSIGTGTGVNTLNSYYQDTNYSYLSCPIIEGTDLLNKNNSWTGTNSFTLATTVPTLTFPSNETKAVNSAYLTSNYVPNSTPTQIAGIKTFTSNIQAIGIRTSTASSNFTVCDTTTTGNIDTGNLQTTGVINIGTGVRTTSGNGGAINIGTGAGCTNSLNISNGSTHSGTVNIMNGAACSGIINLASGTGTTPTTNVNIAAGTTTGVVTIGNSASTTSLNGATTIASVTLPNPINLSYATLPTFTSSQIGYSNVVALNTTFTVPAYVVGPPAVSAHNMQTITLTLGVWAISCGCRYGGGGLQPFSVGISDTINYLQNFSPTSLGVEVNSFANSNFIANGASTYYFIAQNNLATTIAIDSIYVKITRIA
jgi:hypothetical protein